jgi:hypothetical protein
MRAEAFARQAPLPVAIRREDGAPVNLQEWRDNPGATVDPADLSLEQQIALVGARWRAGGWSNLIYGTEGEIDADRAISEVDARSDMGKRLLAIGLRAMEMAREDALQEDQD